MLREQGVWVLLLDDYHHLVDRESERVLFDASDMLKEILIHYPMSVVCAGLPTADAAIRANEQIKRRCAAPVVLPRFDWSSNTSRRTFIAVIRSFSKQLVDIEMPDLDSNAVALRIYLATGGIMDFVAKLLAGAAILATANATPMTMKSLSQAWRTLCFHAAESKLDPFLDKLPAARIPELLTSAKAINAETPVRRRRRRRAADIGM